jgi:drug/metabolite transporter (DMT)-like permease
MSDKKSVAGPGPAASAGGVLALFSNPYVLLALAGLLWSGNHIAGRAVVGQAPPLLLSSARWFIGALVIYPFARAHLAHDWPSIRGGWKIVLALSLSGGAVFSALQYVGLQWTTALNVSVFNSFSPVMMVAAGALFFRDRLAPVQMLGIMTSLTGVLVIVAEGEAARLSALSFNVGDLISLFNMTVWAVYSACLRLRPPMHWTSFTFVLAVVAAFATLPFAVAEYIAGYRFQPSLLSFAVVAYVSVMSGILAFAAWNRGIEMIGSSRGGVFLHLIPIYGAILATTLLGEQLRLFHIAGFVLILAGLYLAVRKP